MKRALTVAGRAAVLGAVHLYRAVSAVTPPSCRFEPTCSHYALTAVRRHGAAYGGWLAARRVLRCHPLGGWGVDPVPPRRTTPGNGPTDGGS